MRQLEVVLAGVPMGKQRVKPSGFGGHLYTPERTVTFEGRLAYAAQQQMGDSPLFDGPLILDIVVLVPIPVSKPKKWQALARAGAVWPTKKPDFDNYAKMVDALNMIVWVDDAIVVRGDVYKFYSDRPAFALRIREADERDRVVPEWARTALARTQEGIFA